MSMDKPRGTQKPLPFTGRASSNLAFDTTFRYGFALLVSCMSNRMSGQIVLITSSTAFHFCTIYHILNKVNSFELANPGYLEHQFAKENANLNRY